MCHKLKDEDEDTYVIHPLLQVGPGRGGDIYLQFDWKVSHDFRKNLRRCYGIFFSVSEVCKESQVWIKGSKEDLKSVVDE